MISSSYPVFYPVFSVKKLIIQNLIVNVNLTLRRPLIMRETALLDTEIFETLTANKEVIKDTYLNCNQSNLACLGLLGDFDLHFVEIAGQRFTPTKKT